MLARIPAPRLRSFLLVLVISLAIPYSSSFAVWLGLRQATDAWLNIRIIGAIGLEIIGLAALALVLLRQHRTWDSLGIHFSWENILHSLGLWIIAYLVYSVVYVIAWYLSVAITGYPIAIQAHNVEFLRDGSMPLLLLFALLNPWFEEIIVRAYTMTELAAFKLPQELVILLSVLLQVGYHLYQGVGSALLISSTFFVFALYYANTRRALPIILAHLYLDIIALLAQR